MSLKLIASVVLTALLLITCRHYIPLDGTAPGNEPPVNSATCNADTVYFTNIILPLVSSNCAMSGCHDPLSHEEGLILNSYAGIMKIVRPGNSGQSKLYEVITENDPGDIMPPPPHTPLPATSISLIRLWINQGAKNNQCTAACDTAVFTYSGAVSPLINTYCKGCHNPASLGGGIDLSTYNGVKGAATTGRLAGSINHAAGFIAMPQGGNKLQDCKIRQIEKWIEAGMVNN